MNLVLNILNTLLPATGLVLAVLIAMRLLRLNAATRYAAWWVVLAVVLVLPFTPRWIESAAASDPLVSLAPQSSTMQLEAMPQTAVNAQPEFDPSVILSLIYAAIAAFLLLRLLVDFLRVRQMLASGSLIDLHCEETRRIRVLVSDRIETPLAVGFLPPKILFPAKLVDRLSAEELRHILVHEAAHISRLDHWANLAGKIVQALCWPHPLVAFVLNRIEVEREHACDDWVVATTGQPASYAKSLTRLVEVVLAGRQRQPLLASSVIGKGPRVSKRVAMLLDRTRNFAPRISLPKLGMSLVCLAVFVAICTQAPMLVAVANPHRAQTQPDPPTQPGRPGLLAALAAAGYQDLSVDEIIELKNQGVDAKFIREMADNGWGRIAPKDLISLRVHNVNAEYMRDIRGAGITGLTLEQAVQLRIHGVNAKTLNEIRALGFGPYTDQEVLDMSVQGIRTEFFRGLKDNGIPQISANDAMSAASHGLNAKSIVEARKYGANLTFEQILKLKRAGVI